MNSLITQSENFLPALKENAEYALARSEELGKTFGGSNSNLMWKTMNIGSQHSDSRSIRQISAELDKKKNAMTEAKYKLLKKIKKLDIKKKKLAKENDKDNQEMLEIEVQELEDQIEMIRKPYNGAVKAVALLGEMLKNYEAKLIEKYGKIDEEVFEIEEYEYWIRRSFRQSIRDIRQNGVILAGNQELLEQIGFNPSTVQNLLKDFLNSQDKNNVGDSELTYFIENCVKEYKPVIKDKIKKQGFQLISTNNLYLDNRGE